MKAVFYDEFKQLPSIEILPDPIPANDGVVIQVQATGLCLSDWHGWMGHDPDIRLPHVPGHELAGIIQAVGKNVKRWKVGDRVTVPFVCGCGICPECISGNHQVCDQQFQPGFTHWGSFAEFVAIDRADVNLVQIPDELNFEAAAILGCRFVTAFRAIVDQGRVSGGEWVAVHGCGGVGLSTIMIANALGANVIAIDISEEKLQFAQSIGAVTTINAHNSENIVQFISEITNGGAHLSIDALGSSETCFNSIANLRKRGIHIQVGLMSGERHQPIVPMDQVIAKELVILGSHGIQAHRYPAIFEMIKAGKLFPGKLIGKTIMLDLAPKELVNMHQFVGTGVTIINSFE